MKNILVEIDFHEKTELLLEKAIELSKPFGAKIWLLHVSSPDPDFVGYEVGPQYIRDSRAEEIKEENRLLSKYVLQLKERDVIAEGLLIQGTTIDVIIDESKKLNIDMIIMGHHKHGFLYKALFGNEDSMVIEKTSIPVLIIPLG